MTLMGGKGLWLGISGAVYLEKCFEDKAMKDHGALPCWFLEGFGWTRMI
jgi:hypothetical protein